MNENIENFRFRGQLVQVVAENRAKRKAETELLEAKIEELKRKIGTFKDSDVRFSERRSVIVNGGREPCTSFFRPGVPHGKIFRFNHDLEGLTSFLNYYRGVESAAGMRPSIVMEATGPLS